MSYVSHWRYLPLLLNGLYFPSHSYNTCVPQLSLRPTLTALAVADHFDFIL